MGHCYIPVTFTITDILFKREAMLKYIIPVVLVLSACGGSKENEKTKEKDSPVVRSFKSESDMDARMAEIDAEVEKSEQIAASLYYSKAETGESFEVLGYLNTQNSILKVEEIFNDGNGKNSGHRYYYLNDGKPFLTIEKYDEVGGAAPVFVDRITYYDKAGKLLKTKERRGPYQEVVETMGYQPAPLKGISIERAMRALNQEKEFATTFQGFIHQDYFTYISVGENKPDGFRTALRCDYKDQLINVLSGNEESYLGEPLRVQFQKHSDENGFEFQVYAGGRFAEE